MLSLIILLPIGSLHILGATTFTHQLIVHLHFLFLALYLFLIISLSVLDFNFFHVFNEVKPKISDWFEDMNHPDFLSSHILDLKVHHDEKEISIRDIEHEEDLISVQIIKRAIIEYTKGDVENLKLLRAYYKTKKTNSSKPIWIAIIGFGIFNISFVIQEIVSGEHIQVYEADLSFPMILSCSVIGFFIIYKSVIGQVQQIDMVHNIIEELITD